MEEVLKRGGLWGVYRFKRGFGGRAVWFSASYDYVYSRFSYWLGTEVYPRLLWVGTIHGRWKILLPHYYSNDHTVERQWEDSTSGAKSTWHQSTVDSMG